MSASTSTHIELWHLVLLLIAFFTFCAAAGRLLLGQLQKHLDERFATQEASRKSNHDALARRLDGIETTNREEAGQWQRVERELLSLKGDLPLQYVRREDYIRGQSVIEAKLDGLASKLEVLQLRSIQNGK
jgi:hypothetical protein